MAHILPSGGGKALMNVDNTVLLLLDHQDGLFLTVKDVTVAELRANVIALARIATLIALSAPPASYMAHVAFARRAGVTPEEVLGVLVAVAPQVGTPRVVAAAAELMMALGLAVERLGN